MCVFGTVLDQQQFRCMADTTVRLLPAGTERDFVRFYCTFQAEVPPDLHHFLLKQANLLRNSNAIAFLFLCSVFPRTLTGGTINIGPLRFRMKVAADLRKTASL